GPLAGAEEQLVVNIAKTGQVYLNDTPYTLSQLTEKLRAFGSARRDRQVYVPADQAGPHGPGTRALGPVARAGPTPRRAGRGPPLSGSPPSGTGTSPWGWASRRSCTLRWRRSSCS